MTDPKSSKDGGRSLFWGCVSQIVIAAILFGGGVWWVYNDFVLGADVKRAGKIFWAALSKTRQLSATKHRAYFVVFDATGHYITIYEDTDNSRTFTSADDRDAIGNPVKLPFDVTFAKVPGPWLGVRPDGSLIWPPEGTPDIPSAEFDRLLADPATANGDVILEKTETGERACIDLDPVTGIVRKIAYPRK